MTQIPEVAVADVPDDAVLLDVREDDEWQAGHAPQAVHVPLTSLAERLDQVPHADPVYVVCRSGGRSSRATEYLNANGWDAVNVTGGMTRWAADGRAMSTDDGRPPTVL